MRRQPRPSTTSSMKTRSISERPLKEPMMLNARSLMVVSMALWGAAAAGCGKTECGSGTVERDGVCVASANGSDGGFVSVQCDPNVSKFEGGKCVPLLPPIV